MFISFLNFCLYLYNLWSFQTHLSYEARPPRGLGEQENKGIYFRGTGEQRPNFEGNRGTKTIMGNREHRKQIFDFGGTGEQANLFQGNKGTLTPPGRASLIL